MAASPLDASVVRYDDAFERVDAQLFRVEAGIATFSLLAMALSYFCKIIYDNVFAKTNFIDKFLLRWMHDGPGEAPNALVDQVHGVYTPAIVVTLLVVLGVGAVRTARVQRAIGAARKAGQPEPSPADVPFNPMTVVFGALVAVFFGVAGYVVVALPSALVCGVLYAFFVLLFARRAARRGSLPAYALTWAVLSVPIGWLIAVLPDGYSWANDLSKILIMYVGFLGASMASRERKHIMLNFGRRLWPSSLKRGIDVGSHLLWLGALVLLFVLGAHVLQLKLESGSTLAILPVAEYHIVLPVVLSFALMALRVGADAVRLLIGAEPVTPPAEPPQVPSSAAPEAAS